ncbi:MAG: adenylate/guanylate cyclase domain-containing protein [Actinomycetota bacterium]
MIQPTGTVTFLFTDIEGSTRILQEHGDLYPRILEDHDRIIRHAIATHHGYEDGKEGDAFFVAFARATDAVNAAMAAQRGLIAHEWPHFSPVRVRMGMHTGEAELVAGGYVGLPVHQAQRISAVAHGGQVLLSHATRSLVEPQLPAGTFMKSLGRHRLKDLGQPQELFQLGAVDLLEDFPVPRSLDSLPNNLPVQLTSFIGREAEVAHVTDMLDASRLLTLTGPGGVGKTRLALQVCAEMLDRFTDGVWMVDLSSTTDPSAVPFAIASSVGLREKASTATADREAEAAIMDRLVEHLGGTRTLVFIDNCEHLIDAAAAAVESILHSCVDVTIFATTRERLAIVGETTWRVPALGFPGPKDTLSDDILSFESVNLFVERSRLHKPDFVMQPQDVPAVAQICRCLDGIPLAIELAAARMRSLSPQQIAERLEDQFNLLAGASRTALSRQQTIRGAIDWSYELLTAPERHLLTALSVFAGSFGLKAVEGICSDEGVGVGEVVDVLTSLVDKSLVTEVGDGVRYRLLETIRRYAWEKLVGEKLVGEDEVVLIPLDSKRQAMKREGEFWTIEFRDEVMRLKHSKGLGYLREMLSQPGRDIHVLDLASGGHLDEDSGDVIDGEASAAYRRRIVELEQELEEARSFNDPARVELANEELQAITDQLRAAFGIGGRARKSGSNTERARVSVTKAIRSTLEKISSNSQPLSAHLEATVKTGLYCSYSPDPESNSKWEL